MIDQQTTDRLRNRLREVAQILIAEVGANGPMDAEDAARKAVERMIKLRALADEKAAEAGLSARRMEQAQRSRDEERKAIVRYLRTRQGYGPIADRIERGEHLKVGDRWRKQKKRLKTIAMRRPHTP